MVIKMNLYETNSEPDPGIEASYMGMGLGRRQSLFLATA